MNSPSLKFDQFRLRDPARPKHSDPRQRATHHCHFVAGIKTWAGLAVLVDLVGQGSAVDYSKAEVKEEIGDASKEADSRNLLLLSLFQQSTQQLTARSLTFGLRLHNNRAHLSQMRAVEVQCAAAKKDARFGFGYSEVADVLADFGVVAAKEGAVVREGVDEVRRC